MDNRFLSGAVILTIVTLTVANPASAETIPFSSTDVREDTYLLNVNYVYNGPTSGSLTISRNNTMVAITTDGGVTSTKYLGNFLLTAEIDPTAGTAKHGAIDLDVKVGGILTPIWNSTNLINFGYSSNLQELDFVFTQSGASLLPGIEDGTTFAVVVYSQNGTSPTNPNWHTSFSATNAKNDGFATVPLPSTAQSGLTLLCLAGLVVGLRRNRRTGGSAQW